MTQGCENLGLVPLRNVVYASIIDSYGDINRTEVLHTHWAARGLKFLYNQVIPREPQRVLLPINKNTNTATLPTDFYQENFVGYICNGEKVRIHENGDLINDCSITVTKDKECPRCKQDKGICESLEVSETEEMITFGNEVHPKTVTKKLYPNGDYFLIISTPVWNIVSDEVDYDVTKEFIVNFEKYPCGCLAKTEENKSNLQNYCPDTYGCYYVPCGCDAREASYKIFPAQGIVQLAGFDADKLYVEYQGYIPKINGTYMVPQVAFETLVDWIKWKAIQNKPNALWNERRDAERLFKESRKSMEQMLWGVSLDVIIQASRRLPKFILRMDNDWANKMFVEKKKAPVASGSTEQTTIEFEGGDHTYIILNE